MKLTVLPNPIERLNVELLIIPLFENCLSDKLIKKIDKPLQGSFKAKVAKKLFTAKHGELCSLDTIGQFKFQQLLFIGLGSKLDLTEDRLRRAAGIAMNWVKNQKVKKFAIELRNNSYNKIKTKELTQYITEGLILSDYSFDQFKSDKSSKITREGSLLLSTSAQKEGSIGVKRGVAIGESVNYARDLGNLPSNIATPRYIAEQASKLGRQSKKLKATILDEAKCKALKMGGLIAVSQGSKEPAKFIILEWLNSGSKSANPIVIVGKGVTFDTGGISIKPSANMEEMKFDMSGAGAVIATMKAISSLNLKTDVVAIAPVTENMPSSTAIKPGDLVTSLSKVTMEVINTDAEGRLILSDALAYASLNYKPKFVVDIATLTGACMVALGKFASGLFSNDDQLAAKLEKAGKVSGEITWRLPLSDEYAPEIKSSVADIKNVGSRYGGAITAALFLSRHTKERWAHIDIAGCASNDAARHYLPTGSAGYGVRILLAFIENEMNA
ncbi:MAG: leucyl aminopeptidase [Nitrospinota bacterium]